MFSLKVTYYSQIPLKYAFTELVKLIRIAMIIAVNSYCSLQVIVSFCPGLQFNYAK